MTPWLLRKEKWHLIPSTPPLSDIDTNAFGYRISPRSIVPVLTSPDTLLSLSSPPRLPVDALSNCPMLLVSPPHCPSSLRPTVPLTSPKPSSLRSLETTGTCVLVSLSRNLTCSDPSTKRPLPTVTSVAPSSPGSNLRTSSFKRPKSAWCFQQTSLKVYLCISLFSQLLLFFSFIQSCTHHSR